MDWTTAHPLFEDRVHAGRELARELARELPEGDRGSGQEPNGERRPGAGRDVLVLALPRGGVPVAAQIAEHLRAALDVWVVRKLGVPGMEELAMGAMAGGGVVEVDRSLLERLAISEEALDAVIERETAELERRERLYRRGRPAPDVQGRTVILVDDGLATGATMHAAVTALRARDPARIVVAAPVASRPACQALDRHADACICLAQPEPFLAVGPWYADFHQTSDEEVADCLERAEARRAAVGHP